jgi:CRP/FNR family cyclic AMP-dependent transcriptional regulator
LAPQSQWTEFLLRTPLFVSLHPTDVVEIARDFRTRTYRKREIIFHQGDESTSLFVIMQGKVRVYHLTAGGEETTVNILWECKLLGEFALLDGLPRSASAEAITACTLLEIPASRCLYHLEHSRGLGLSMCRQLTAKARWTSSYAEAISRLDATSRFLYFLLIYNKEFGQEIEPRKRYSVQIGLTQSELATLIGVDRQHVNTILGELKRRGLVEFDHGTLTILDLSRITSEIEGQFDIEGNPWTP